MSNKNIRVALLTFTILSVLYGCRWIPTEDTATDQTPSITQETPAATPSDLLSQIPEWDGKPSIIINNNLPFFTETEKTTTTSFETYSELDALGRCQAAYACIGTDLMPTEERGDIGSIRPTGWHTVKYPDQISDRYLYNRCHLIGYQLTGENANERNLITGTRYLNIEGMLPWENQVADYIETTGNHVLYRVTPIFLDDDLVCRGILMEAWSIEDDGCRFCVYCYNVQPKISIDYATGNSWITAERRDTP